MATDKQIIIPDEHISEQAMARVLEAEKAANQAIKNCEQEAVEMVQQAREKAQKISKHTDKRITYIHLRFKQCINRQVKDLQREYAEQQKHISAEHYSQEDLEDIIETIAELLTGGEQTAQSQ